MKTELELELGRQLYEAEQRRREAEQHTSTALAEVKRLRQILGQQCEKVTKQQEEILELKRIAVRALEKLTASEQELAALRLRPVILEDEPPLRKLRSFVDGREVVDGHEGDEV